MLLEVTRGYRGPTRDNRGLQRFTGGYKPLQGVTSGCKGL